MRLRPRLRWNLQCKIERRRAGSASGGWKDHEQAASSFNQTVLLAYHSSAAADLHSARARHQDRLFANANTYDSQPQTAFWAVWRLELSQITFVNPAALSEDCHSAPKRREVLSAARLRPGI